MKCSLVKTISFFMALLLCFSFAINLSKVQAAEEIYNSVGATKIENGINKIRSIYPDGSYFTVSGNICYSVYDTDCELSRMPSRGGLPSGSDVAKICGNAWSCCSFAKYVFYTVFGISPLNCAKSSSSNLQIGDYIEFNSTSYGNHYGIFLGQDDSNWYVYDSNFKTPASNRVRYYGAIRKSGAWITDVRHAGNYDDMNKDSYVDLGTDFYALIINVSMWKPLTVEQNKNVDIKTGKYFDCPDQIWKFERQFDGSYKIISLANKECLDVEGAGTNSGTNVQTCVDHNHDAQRWFIYSKNGGLVLRTKISNCVLDVNGGNSVDGTNVQVWEENDSLAQIFSIYKVETNQFALYLGNDFTAPILNSYHWKPITNDNTNNAIIDNENGTANQVWRFLYQIDGSYKIVSCIDGKCLDVQGASYEGGANVQTYTDHNHDAQRWYILPCNGGYLFQSKLSGFFLNISSDGTNIQLWDKTLSESQVFSIYTGEECKLSAPILEADIEKNTVLFSWNNVYGEYFYNLRIWKERYWQGDSYYDIWNIPANTTSIEVSLPVGKYEAYVDTGNYYEGKMSNVVSFEIEEIHYEIGDTNLDDIISINDATAIQLYIVELKKFTDEQLSVADTNGDGKIDIADATHLQKYLAKFDGVVLGKQ